MKIKINYYTDGTLRLVAAEYDLQSKTIQTLKRQLH